MTIRAIILAAGEGKRMQSALPKVLHEVCGRSLARWVMHTVAEYDTHPIVVVGHGRDQVCAALADTGAQFVVQEQLRGTGDAARTAVPLLREEDTHVLICAGDMPLIEPQTITNLVQATAQGAPAALLATVADDPTGYGRVLSDDAGHALGIVEHRDASPEQLAIRQINTSVYCFEKQALLQALAALDCDNAQGEYYLTDTIAHIAAHQGGVQIVLCAAEQAMGINDRVQLAQAERLMRARINRSHMLAGVTLIDPATTYIGPDVQIGWDTIIHPNTTLTGTTLIGANCRLIGPCHIQSSVMENDVQIQASTITGAYIGEHSTVGPYAHLRPRTHVGVGVHIGDFVELKNCNIGNGTKVSHLTYVGDADIGEQVNVGCGVVFVNYDGKTKHRTHVDDRAFIGCNTNLVAPVNVGAGAYTAAGSTITKDVPDGALAVARARQENKADWVAKRWGGK